jgi:hypothetical protein
MRRVIGILASLVLLSCGDDGGTGPQGLVLSRASSSGDGQTGAPGAALSPFRVQLTNNGVPVEGTIVNWNVQTGGGTLSVPTSVTDASGVAATTLTLGPDGGPDHRSGRGHWSQRVTGDVHRHRGDSPGSSSRWMSRMTSSFPTR